MEARARPESSSSRDTRLTPSSSNGSSANLAHANVPRGASGGSLLQERLRERKVESARQSRRRSVDLGAGGRVMSSPIKDKMVREERRPSSSGVAGGKGMGVKQIEEQVSTLHKQNFDLKLELYHRRERQQALEAQLDEMEKQMEEQMEEQRELQEVNEQLLAELEKRDQAVEEAVGIIVGLEDKVDRLMEEREVVRTFDAQYDSGYFQEGHEFSSSPPVATEKQARSKTEGARKSLARMPSFLSEQSEGAEALRSLYLPQSHAQSESTLPKLLEEASTSAPDSPRLSVLSESSFLSVYGERGLALVPAPESEEEGELPLRTHRKSTSVEKWIDERPASTNTPMRPVREGIRKNGFLSITDVLESPLQRLEKLKHNIERHTTDFGTSRLSDNSRLEEKRKSRELLRRGFTDKASFEHQHALPPTPDTISTGTLRHYQNSNDTLADDANDRAFLSSTSTYPVPIPSHNAHQSKVSMRPRSAGETITSRRDGHGWDTETAEDLTETGSLLSSTTSAHAYTPRVPHKRIVEPDMFSFNDLDDPRDWARELLFNEEPIHLPAHTTKRYERLRRASLIEPHSDDTVVASRASRYASEQVPNQYGVSPIDDSPRPSMPARRSSLSATVKLRKKVAESITASSPVSKDSSSTSTSTGKKSRLAMPRLFLRSESIPSPTQSAIPRARARNLGFESAGTELGESRATPPPIKRNRTMPVPSYRPLSAGEGAERVGGKEEVRKRRSGSMDLGPEVGDVSKGGRKWGVFGRTASIKR